MNRAGAVRELCRPVAYVVAEGITSVGVSALIFALEVWVFQKTGSYAVFASIAAAAALSGVLAAPFSGTLIDRTPRGLLLVSLAAAGIGVCAIAWSLQELSAFDVVAAAVLAVFLSVMQTVRMPAVMATVSLVTPGRHIERISAMEEAVEALVVISAPILGAWLMLGGDLKGTFVACGIALGGSAAMALALRLPMHGLGAAGERGPAAKGYVADMVEGARWLLGRPVLRRLLLFVAVLNIGTTTFVTVQSPRALLHIGVQDLAQVLSAGGIGLLCGGVIVTLTGGLRPHTRALYLGSAGIAAGMLVSALSSGKYGFMAGSFLFAFLHPFVNTAMQVMWRTETPIGLQGRVFSLRRMTVSGLGPLAIAASVPLSQHVFGPLLQAAGDESSVVSTLFGRGQSGELGLMLAFYVLAMWILIAMFRARRFLEPSVDEPAAALGAKPAEDLTSGRT